MPNPFDQFDQPQKRRSNPFDQFDAPLAADGAQAASGPAQPQAPHGFMEGLRGSMTGMINQFLGGTQRSSPLAEAYGAPLGEMGQNELGQDIYTDPQGHFQRVDSAKHVVLLDPQGKPVVYPRSSGSDEGILPSIGRVLGGGAISTAPTRLASAGAKTAAKAVPQLIEDFNALGVRPNLAAVTQSQSAGMVQQTMKNLPGVGEVVSHRMRGTLSDLGEASKRIAAGYGDVTNTRVAGQRIQKGLETFGEKTVPVRADELYGKFWSHFAEGETVEVGKTVTALGQSAKRFDNPELGQQFIDPTLAKWAGILEKSEGRLTVSDARNLRTEIGKKLKFTYGPNEIDQVQLQRAYGALSEDIRAAAVAKGPEALKDLWNADRYWGAAKDRLKNLADLTKTKNATPEDVYADLIKMARSKGSTADFGKLAQARRAAGSDAWNDFVGAFIVDMGTPSAGSADVLSKIGFSPAQLVTKWSSLSDSAKTILFAGTGKAEWAAQMDKLARVAGSVKNVEKLANPSGTGRIIMTGMMGYGAVTISPVTTALVMMAGMGTEELIMNPLIVRWLVGLPQAVKNPGTWAGSLSKLRLLAANPEVGPTAYRLAQALEDRYNGSPVPTAR